MSRSILVAALLAVLPWGSARAQLCGRGAGSPTDMRVQLSFDEQTGTGDPSAAGATVTNDASHRSSGGTSGQHSADFSSILQIRVQLQDGYGSNISETQPNGEGQVVFRVCSHVTYRVRVTAPDLEEVVADDLEAGRGDRIVNLLLRRKDRQVKNTNSGLISAKRLKIPKAAQKQLIKGNTALAAGRLQEAETAYRKAIAEYDEFDQAYNNLAVVLMKSGRSADGKKAFEKAASINADFSRALSNLAKVALNDKEYSKSLDLVKRALETEPLNPGTLLVGTEAAFLAGDYNDSITYARLLHSLPHSGMGLAHYLCGRSLEKQNMLSEALAEYQTFLMEDPGDPNAARAQMAIEELRAAKHAPVN